MSVRDRIKRMEQMAMQEREAAPDERGRSPGGVSMASNTSASGSPRPLSKVRTSFVAIADKEGRIGLHRQPSGDSSFSDRKLSGDTDAASSILLDSSRSNALSSSPDAFRSDRSRGPSGSFSRSALQNPGAAAGDGHTSAAPPTASPSSAPVADLKPPTTTTTATNTTPARTTATDPKPSGPVPDSSLASGSGQQGLAASPQITKAPRGEEAVGQRVSTGKPGQAVQTRETQSTRDQGQAQAGKRDNGLNRGGTKERGASRGAEGAGGNTVAGTTALNGADKAKTTKPAPTSSAQPKPAGKAPDVKGTTTPAAAAEKRPAEKKATPSNASPPFVKPRPKSPTQPIKLPERLTTHTGASAAKSKNAPPPVRPASRTSVGTSGKVLGRSSSVAGRQHSSFGPPPKRAVDHPVLKKESRVDEGFLARMMRPTQAYANKVADKVQLPPKTPPRATATKNPSSAKPGPVKKTVLKSTTTSAAASPETAKSEQSSAGKQAAKKQESIPEEPVVAKKAEETLPPAKKVVPAEKEAEQSLSASEKKTDLSSKLSETKGEVSKSADKESAAQAAETQDKIPEAKESNEAASKSLEKEDNTSQSFEPKNQASEPPQQSANLAGSQQEQDIKEAFQQKENAPELAEEKKTISQAFNKTADTPKASSEMEDFSQDSEKENEPQSLGKSWAPTKLTTSDKMNEPLKDPEKASDGKSASDASFEAFMNPGSEKAAVYPTNGNYKEEGKTNGHIGNTEDAKPSFQPATTNPSDGQQQSTHSTSDNASKSPQAEQPTNGLPGTAQAQDEEVEEW